MHCTTNTASTPFIPPILQPSVPAWTPPRLSAAQLKEQIERKKARNAAKIDAKAKVKEATDTKAKLRTYTTLLKLKLHITKT